jgi:hypothetical protein
MGEREAGTDRNPPDRPRPQDSAGQGRRDIGRVLQDCRAKPVHISFS